MKKSQFIQTALLILIGAFLTACADSASAALTGSWKLVSYGSPANPTPAAPNVEASLTFGKDGLVSGSVGCNSFSGDYKVKGGALIFGMLATTEMACDEPLMQQESAVFRVIGVTTSFKIEGDTLTLISADGNSIAAFIRK
jgi:heat shock protein HslJ